MSPTVRLVLYGNSIFLAGLKADLKKNTSVEIISMEAGRQDALELILAIHPDAVLFDLNSNKPDFVLELFLLNPDLIFIGMDLNSDQTLFLSAQRSKVLTSKALYHCISKHVEHTQNPLETYQDPQGGSMPNLLRQFST